MKWIDFDQLENLDNEDDLKQNKEASYFDEELDKDEDVDDDEHLALPKDLFSEPASKSYNEEEYLSLPKEEKKSVPAHRRHRKTGKDVLLNMETEPKDIYAMPEEEAQRITMEEKRSQIGRMLGLRTIEDKLEEKQTQEKGSTEQEEAELQIPEYYFEDMADHMAEEMLEEEKEREKAFEKEREQTIEPELESGAKQEESEAESELEVEPELKPESEAEPEPEREEPEQKKEYDPLEFGSADEEYERFRERYLKKLELGLEEPESELKFEVEQEEQESELKFEAEQEEPEEKPELEAEMEEEAEEEQEEEPRKEYDPLEFGSADEEYEKFRERYRRGLFLNEDEQIEEHVPGKTHGLDTENGIESDIDNDIEKEDETVIQALMPEEEKQNPEETIVVPEGDIEEIEENTEDTEESAFVDEEVFRQIELVEKKKWLGVDEEPEEGQTEEAENRAEKEPEEEKSKSTIFWDIDTDLQTDNFDRKPLEEGQTEEAENRVEKEPEEGQIEETENRVEKEPEEEQTEEFGNRAEEEQAEETENRAEVEPEKELTEETVEKSGEKEAPKEPEPALKTEASKEKARPQVLNTRELSGENQSIKTTVGTLKKRTLPRRQLGLDKDYAQKNLQDTIEQRKNGKIVKTAEQLEKKLQDSSVKGKESSKKIDKLHSAFEEEFQDATVDDLLVRRNKVSKKKAKKRKDHAVAWEKDDTPDHPFREFLTLIVAIAAVVFVTFVLVEFIGQRTEVSGSSMEKTLQDGDNLIVDKITYEFQDPERFDIIVFPYVNASGEEVYFIKRIIGLPGEKVRIDNGFIYINDEKLEESYGKDNELILNAGRAVNNVLLGEDEYFVLGDNRNDSADSREIGNVKRDQIVGRAWLRIWPINKFGIMKHQ